MDYFDISELFLVQYNMYVFAVPCTVNMKKVRYDHNSFVMTSDYADYSTSCVTKNSSYDHTHVNPGWNV